MKEQRQEKKPKIQEKTQSKQEIDNNQESKQKKITTDLVNMLIEFNKKNPTTEEQITFTDHDHIHKIINSLN